MTQRLATRAGTDRDVAWLPAAVEARLYEGIRQGEEAAFQNVAQPLQPVLFRLSRLSDARQEAPELRVVRTWTLALGGLDMFRWQTPFATWVAGITVALGRSQAEIPPRSNVLVAPQPVPGSAARGPPDWSDFPWSARWSDAWPTLRSAVESLPLPQREVIHTHDIEGWPRRRVCDVLGLPEATCLRLLGTARLRLRDALAPLVGAPPVDRFSETQATAVATMLPRLLEQQEQDLDPRTSAAFRRWARSGRKSRWALALAGHRTFRGQTLV